MIEKIPALAQLCKSLQQVPFLASRNLYKVATYFLKSDNERIEKFCTVLLKAKHAIISCPLCGMWKEKTADCVICADKRRDASVVCVVETWQELMAIEKTEGYRGMYHVLGGVICPLEGIGPEDLSITLLQERVKKGDVKEVILAMNQTPEGEATSAYIARLLKAEPVALSCLARGMPVGSILESMDKLTVFKALSERRPF